MKIITSLILIVFLSILVLLIEKKDSKVTQTKDADWVICKEDLNLDLPENLNEGEQHKIEISRNYQNDFERNLLKKAESIYPNKDNMLLILKENNVSTNNEEHIWWYSTFDKVKIPYSVTAGAVKYYLNLIKSFRNADFSNTSVEMKSSKLYYTASIKYHIEFVSGDKKFSNVYVTNLELSWSQYCGSLCAMAFSKKRVVFFNKDGVLLTIFGDDDKTPMVIS